MRVVIGATFEDLPETNITEVASVLLIFWGFGDGRQHNIIIIFLWGRIWPIYTFFNILVLAGSFDKV